MLPPRWLPEWSDGSRARAARWRDPRANDTLCFVRPDPEPSRLRRRGRNAGADARTDARDVHRRWRLRVARSGGAYLNRSPTGIDHCTGDDGYSDIKPGLQVVIRDGDGSTLGTGHLAYDHEAYQATDDRCPLVFEVDVPRSDFYAIEVGDRGELTYSFDDMEAMGWRVEASLGG